MVAAAGAPRRRVGGGALGQGGWQVVAAVGAPRRIVVGTRLGAASCRFCGTAGCGGDRAAGWIGVVGQICWRVPAAVGVAACRDGHPEAGWRLAVGAGRGQGEGEG